MKTTACTAIACAGTMASHHCLVRHQNSPTNSTHAPMMNSVVPIPDRTAVTEFSAGVRTDSNQRFTAASRGQAAQRTGDEEPDADDDDPQPDGGQEHPDGEVPPGLLAGGRGRVELVAVQEGVHHVTSGSGAVADQPL